MGSPLRAADQIDPECPVLPDPGDLLHLVHHLEAADPADLPDRLAVRLQRIQVIEGLPVRLTSTLIGLTQRVHCSVAMWMLIVAINNGHF